MTDLRDREHLYGLPGLAPADQAKPSLRTQLMEATAQLVHVAHHAQVAWSVENPDSSLIWAMPPQARPVHFDMCRFGSPHKKPTTVLANYDLGPLALRCDRQIRAHEHEPLEGKVCVDGRWVYRTCLAQVYPQQLCSAWARLVPGGDPLEATFHMTTSDRKRRLGQPMPWKSHRQQATAEKAQAAGYQLKRAAVPPLLQKEMEPGQAVRTALEIPHPFSLEPPLPPDLQEALAMAVLRPEATLRHRGQALAYWQARADLLVPATDQILKELPDPHLRRLLRGAEDDQPLQLGKFTHIALWRELAAAARCIDTELISSLIKGFPIVGPVARSRCWAPLHFRAALSVADLAERAWELSRKVEKNISQAELVYRA